MFISQKRQIRHKEHAGLPRVRFEMLGIAARDDVGDLHYST